MDSRRNVPCRQALRELQLRYDQDLLLRWRPAARRDPPDVRGVRQNGLRARERKIHRCGQGGAYAVRSWGGAREALCAREETGGTLEEVIAWLWRTKKSGPLVSRRFARSRCR